MLWLLMSVQMMQLMINFSTFQKLAEANERWSGADLEFIVPSLVTGGT
jgi:hypothetical protein